MRFGATLCGLIKPIIPGLITPIRDTRRKIVRAWSAPGASAVENDLTIAL
ncbi:hypothetical protein PAMC26510_07385 [Caballeronia sordidicola]|uniref:Uncharacterized protein n=1 Tax=Caballeronia sordidicola TaxID=196367 RepID=A0A242N4D6_CABSO|nr:hypothetical protein PAMC26510_07385 [Caballeronia sordidicola]